MTGTNEKGLTSEQWKEAHNARNRVPRGVVVPTLITTLAVSMGNMAYQVYHMHNPKDKPEGYQLYVDAKETLHVLNNWEDRLSENNPAHPVNVPYKKEELKRDLEGHVTIDHEKLTGSIQNIETDIKKMEIDNPSYLSYPRDEEKRQNWRMAYLFAPVIFAPSLLFSAVYLLDRYARRGLGKYIWDKEST